MNKPTTNPTMSASEIEKDAYTVSAYMTLESIENELQDCYDLIEAGDSYGEIANVIAVLEKASELLN